ncbi:MAG: alpha-galactosidase, partial [Clostridiales bacterium]|nr:alpha-galactosidase [Clostridiales bacterium]
GYNGVLFSEQNGFKTNGKVEVIEEKNGSIRKIAGYKSNSGDLEVRNIIVTFPELNIMEKWIEVINVSSTDIHLTRIDTYNGILQSEKYTLKYFMSSWGNEFMPVDVPLEGTKTLEVTSGRSSNGMHPWFCVTGENGSILTCSIAWSGNWIARFMPDPAGGYSISGGISDWNFSKTLKPGQVVEGIHVIYVSLHKGDLNDTSIEFQRWGRIYQYPRNTLSNNLPTEWNTWWPYEDVEVNEDIFKTNVDECAKLGTEVCTLDAGWFGRSDDSHWYKVRGDWHKVNDKRFPSGIRALSDYVHSKGLKFGIWCEIEALGVEAELSEIHPEYVARRDGEHLGYVCMGNPETVEWAFGVLEKLIMDYKADWIKLDFNLDPKAGCNRKDHGHGAGDGLFEHYMGYYKLLDMIRGKYPEVFLENCSSGGLRLDLGMLKHTHTSYLSDPDYTEHSQQLIWGASTMFHPSVCLHWSWSQTRKEYTANIDNEPVKEDMPRYKFDYFIRTSMLGGFGYSYRLPELPEWCLERLKLHTDFYKDIVRDILKEADMYTLSGQVIRNGRGDRWSAFLYVNECRKDSILFVFRLKGGEKERAIKLKGLKMETIYKVQYQDNGRHLEKYGRDLMEDGLKFDEMEEEASEIVLITC